MGWGGVGERDPDQQEVGWVGARERRELREREVGAGESGAETGRRRKGGREGGRDWQLPQSMCVTVRVSVKERER